MPGTYSFEEGVASFMGRRKQTLSGDVTLLQTGRRLGILNLHAWKQSQCLGEDPRLLIISHLASFGGMVLGGRGPFSTPLGYLVWNLAP